MAHLSVGSTPLTVERGIVYRHEAIVDKAPTTGPMVCLLVLPFEPSGSGLLSNAWHESIRAFIERAHPETVVAILTHPAEAATLWPHVETHLQMQLWVSVKLTRPVETPGFLSMHHAALLVLTKYRGSLRHTKTRVAYTYCPACEKTTKDYGGKKHIYHEYGTLLSDVWRDVAIDPNAFPEGVVSRLSDLFGLAPYDTLRVLDMRAAVASEALPPSCGEGLFQCKPLDYTTDPNGHLSPRRRSKLVNTDCMKALARIPSDSVEFCFADPPYNLSKHYDNCSDSLDMREYFDWCDHWLSEMARITKPGCVCAVLNIPILAVRHFSHMRKELSFLHWIAWEGLGLPVRMIMPAHYAIICFAKGQPRPLPGVARARHAPEELAALTSIGECYCVRSSCVKSRQTYAGPHATPITDLWWDIHRLKHNSRRVDHPCQLPPALMYRLIALFTNKGEWVLDPFNGAGTTTLVAELLERKFIGIELSEQYHLLAVHRHQELASGLNPFRKLQGIPVAKNSRVKRLKKQRYEVSKKVLQLEVRRIAHELGRLPTRGEVENLSKYPMDYFEKYFISWGEVCAAARTTGMSETRKNSSHARDRQRVLFS